MTWLYLRPLRTSSPTAKTVSDGTPARSCGDDLEILDVSDDDVIARGFNAPMHRQDEFTVELATGKPSGHPYLGRSV